MNCVDVDCCVLQIDDAKAHLKRLLKHLWSHEKTYVLLKVGTLEFEVLEHKSTRERLRQMVSRTVYCNLLAMMLYGIGHPICGNVLIVPRH